MRYAIWAPDQGKGLANQRSLTLHNCGQHINLFGLSNWRGHRTFA